MIHKNKIKIFQLTIWVTEDYKILNPCCLILNYSEMTHNKLLLNNNYCKKYLNKKLIIEKFYNNYINWDIIIQKHY